MKKKWRLAVGLVIAFLTLSLIIACASARNPLYVYTNGATEVGADGEPIELVNNSKAVNPTYEELLNFIRLDKTDRIVYSENRRIDRFGNYDPFVCADYAEAVHNTAEAVGIRAAWVGLDFESEEIGHAINAFEVVNKGLVFVDCTGGNKGFDMNKGVNRLLALLRGQSVPTPPDSWDAIAYVEIGKEYGLIPLDSAKRLSYQFYQEYKNRWQEFETFLSDYNEEIAKFNQEVTGRIYIIGSAEWQKMKEWEASLKAQEEELDKLSEGLSDYWFEPVGIITDIQIYWGKE